MARVSAVWLNKQLKRPKGWTPRTVVVSAEDREVLGA